MSELFDVPESLSPRLAWIKKHRATVHWSEEDAEYYAYMGSCCSVDWYGWGETEDDALFEMAKKRGLKLWNEEGYGTT
jgi:hypothetical protein